MLAAIYHEFCVRAFDEGDSGGWREVVELADLIGDGILRFDAFTLGQLAERSGVDVDNSPNVDGDVMSEVLHAEHPAVVEALLRTANEAGSQSAEAQVFAELWLANQDEIAYPITDVEVGHIANYDLSAGKHQAYEWLTDGLSII